MRLLPAGPARRAVRDLRARAPDRRHRRRRARRRTRSSRELERTRAALERHRRERRPGARRGRRRRAPLPDPARGVRRARRRRRARRARRPSTRRSPSSSATAAASPARSAGSRSASSTAPTAIAGAPLADDLGVALQIGNILRDVERGRRQRARLPARARISSGSAARRTAAASTGPIELVIAFEAERGLGWLRPRARRSCRCSTAAAPPACSRWPASTAGCSSGSPPSRRSSCAAGCRSAPGRRASCSPAASPGPAHDAPRIAVVGGGLAGLAAAIECADGGADGDALRGALAARRRDVLVRAQRRSSSTTASTSRSAAAPPTSASCAGSASTHLAAAPARASTSRCSARASRPALISRNGLPAPLHLATTLLRYAPLSDPRARSPPPAPRPRSSRLDPDDPRARRADVRATGCARTASPRTRSTALWNLIALPTLNLPADEASLAAAVKVFRTGPARQRRRVPTSASRPCRSGGSTPSRPPPRSSRPAAGSCIGTPVRSVTADRQLVLRRRRRRGRRRHPRRPARGRSPSSPRRERSTPRRSQALGTSPIVNLHVHYDRRVLDEPLAAALDSPVQWIFDRTERLGRARGPARRRLALARGRRDRRLGRRAARALPAGARAAAACRARRRRCSTSPSRTSRARPSAPRPARGSSGPGRAPPSPGVYLAGAWTDTGWPATMEGAVRSGLDARARRSPLARRAATLGSAA